MNGGLDPALEFVVAEIGVTLKTVTRQDVASPLHPHQLLDGYDDLLLAIQEPQHFARQSSAFGGLQHDVAARGHVAAPIIDLALASREHRRALALLIEEIHPY